MTLNKRLISSFLALVLLLGISHSYAVLTAKQIELKERITSQGLAVDDEDVILFDKMYSQFVPLLADKWKEAKAAGMSNLLIHAIIGDNKNQFALDVLTAEIAKRKTTTAGTSNGASTLTISTSTPTNTTSPSKDVPGPLTRQDVDEALKKYHPTLPADFRGKEQVYALLLSKAKTKDDLNRLAGSLKVSSVDPSLAPTPAQYKVLLEKRILPEKYDELRKYGYSFEEIIQNAQTVAQFEAFLAQARLKAKPSVSPSGSGSASSTSSAPRPTNTTSPSTDVPGPLTRQDVDEALKRYHPTLPADFRGKEQVYALLLSKAKTKDDLNRLAGSLKVSSVDPSLAPTPAQYKVILEKRILPEKYDELRKYGYSFEEIIQNAQTVTQFEAFLAQARLKAKPSVSPSGSGAAPYIIQTDMLFGLYPELKNSKDPQKLENSKDPQIVGPVLEKIRQTLEDARPAGFEDKQINDLWLKGFPYSKWREYVKLPGKSPKTFYQAIMQGGREASLAFFGLDEKQATNLQGRKMAETYSNETKNLVNINPQSALWYNKQSQWSDEMVKSIKDDLSQQTSAPASPPSAANSNDQLKSAEDLPVPPAPRAAPGSVQSSANMAVDQKLEDLPAPPAPKAAPSSSNLRPGVSS